MARGFLPVTFGCVGMAISEDRRFENVGRIMNDTAAELDEYLGYTPADLPAVQLHFTGRVRRALLLGVAIAAAGHWLWSSTIRLEAIVWFPLAFLGAKQLFSMWLYKRDIRSRLHSYSDKWVKRGFPGLINARWFLDAALTMCARSTTAAGSVVTPRAESICKSIDSLIADIISDYMRELTERGHTRDHSVSVVGR